MKNLSYCILLGAFLFLFTGCKPTEKNYKSAYDAALGKRQSSMNEIDGNNPEGKLQQVDGAQLKVVDGISVYVLNKRIFPAEDNMSLPGNYNVAIGAYKMITNCKAQSEVLKEEGYSAFPAKEPEGMYYTIAGSFPTLSDAVKFYSEYQRGKGKVYVGLPDAPIIIYSPK